MMKYIVVLFAILSVAAQSSASTGSSELFTPVTAASKIPVPAAAQAGSSFLAVNPIVFTKLVTDETFICTIANFPLGVDGVGDLRVEQFEVVSKSVKGRTAIADHVFFRGFVEGSENSHVFLALFADRAFGYITRDGRCYSISAAGRNEDGSLVIGSYADTTRMDNFHCGSSENPGALAPGIEAMLQTLRARPMSAPKSDSVRLLTVGLELDADFVAQRGGTAQSALAYAISTLAAASDIYTRDAGIALQCVDHTEYEGVDPYSAGTACELLWEIQPPTSGVVSAIWVTMSGRPTDWCGGIADGIGILCDDTQWAHCVCGIEGGAKPWAYPYKSFVWDIMVTAHETGHLVACPHTHSCYWDPPIDSCVESEGGCFDGTKPTVGTIMSYCHTTAAGAKLKFHPLCSALMMAQLDQSSCYTPLALPAVTLSPSRIIEQCAGGMYSVTSTPHGGTAPYTIETNPKADTITQIGSGWKLQLNATRYQRYYLRITDALGNRSYDSVVFASQPGFSVAVKVDTVTLADSAILTPRSTPGVGNVTYRWYRVGSTWSLNTGAQFTVARNERTNYYCAGTTVGGCVARDTFTVTALVAGVGTSEAVATLHLAPNPARTEITIYSAPAGANCSIVDVLGRMVSATVRADAHGSATLDVARLANGVYYVVYDDGERHGSLKFRKE